MVTLWAYILAFLVCVVGHTGQVIVAIISITYIREVPGYGVNEFTGTSCYD